MSVSEDYVNEAMGDNTKFANYDKTKNQRLNKEVRKPQKPLDKATERKLDQGMRKDADKELNSNSNKNKLLR